MPEATQIAFKHREIVELLLKKQGIHEGIWGLFIRFGFGASNVGPTETDVSPAAMVSVLEIGLQKFEKESNIAVNAAVVNPKSAEAVQK